MYRHRRRFICYTRLCLNIAKDIERVKNLPAGINSPVRPKKTHQLIVGRFGLLSMLSNGSGATLELISSLSSSLPADAEGRFTQQELPLKVDATAQRRGIVIGLGGNYPQAMAHIHSTNPRIHRNAGAACAETINIAW